MSKPGISLESTLRVRDACLCLHVQRAARTLARMFDEAFRPVGLTNGQFSLMMALNRPKRARMRELSTFLAMDRTTLTAALKPLERRGLVVVEPDPEDRRGRLLGLSDAGRARLAEALPIWIATHGELERQLPAGDGDQLRAALVALA